MLTPSYFMVSDCIPEKIWYTICRTVMTMCGRYTFSKDSSSEMVQDVLQNLQSRNIEVKTGEVFPGRQSSPAIGSLNRRHLL